MKGRNLIYLPSRRAVLLAAIAPFASLPSFAEPCGGTISQEGKALARFLDDTGVDHLWQAHWHVDWQTGKADRDRPGGREAATHCSAFVAAVAQRLGIYVLRPPEHAQELLANAQMAWMQTEGLSLGWRQVADTRQAQELANGGSLVVAAFAAPSPHKPGHIAIVRPSMKDCAQLDSEGPQITQAGVTNYLSTSVAEGFKHHHGAWGDNGIGAIRFYAHAIERRRLIT